MRVKNDDKTQYSQVSYETFSLGEILNFDVLIKKDAQYVIIIEVGTLLTAKLMRVLQKQELLYRDRYQKKLSCQSLSSYMKSYSDDPVKCIQLLSIVNARLFDKFLHSSDNKIDIECVKKIILNIIALLENREGFLQEIIPTLSTSVKLEEHPFHVCIYALSLAKALKFSDDEMQNIGLAGLLHDIGKKLVNDIIGKEKTLSMEEFEQVHHHVEYSVDIVQHNHLHNPYIVSGIKEHHERFDGTGYPNKLHSNEISPFGAILAICDVFDALTSNRPHRKNYTSFDTLSMLLEDQKLKGSFNATYLKIFINLLHKSR